MVNFYNRPLKYISVASINTGETSAKSAMCGKIAVISDEHNSNQNRIMEGQIDGISYTFYTADCAMNNDVCSIDGSLHHFTSACLQ